MPVYHSGNLSGGDRNGPGYYNLPLRPQTRDLTLPLGPKNLMVTSPYLLGMNDVRWDDPRVIPQNNGLNIIGVNVYRATDAQFGPFVKINETPVGVLFYRDKTIEEYVSEEDATGTLRIMEPDNRWLIYTKNRPVVEPGSNGQTTDNIKYVKVEIDDGDGQWLEVPAYTLNGHVGEIALITRPIFNHILEQVIPPRLPHPPNGKVRISYRYLKHAVVSSLNQRIFYKVTTVAQDPDNPSGTIETPLEEVNERSTFDIDEVDWIWKEAMRRNMWILEQGGERVKIFVRKWMGQKCESYEPKYGQSHHDCPICKGTGIVGGYEGPYDILIAPPETERSIELGDMGLHIRYDWMTWTMNYPLLNPRDFIVRQNNERYIVGPVNYQGQRGVTFQQHFTMSYIDTGDVRYTVPITGGETSVPESTNAYREPLKSEASPVIPMKPEIPDTIQVRGRTVTWENITW